MDSKTYAGNLYGLDIKLTNVEGHLIPVAIEMNGVDSGTNFFGYEEGFLYYSRFARVLAASTNGKPIFIEGGAGDKQDELSKVVRKAELEEERKRQMRHFERIASLLGDEFRFEYSWFNDLHQFNVSRLDALDDSEDRFYLWAAREEGIPLFVFRDIKYKKDSIEFLLESGRTISMQPDHIGVIRPYSSRVYDVPDQFKHLFLNSPLIETLLDSKPLLYVLGIEFNPTFHNFFAPAVPYGLGVNDVKSVLLWLTKYTSDLIVRKRGSSYCGTGVEILKRDEVLKELFPRINSATSPGEVQALTLSVQKSVMSQKLEEFVSMYERFISSIPIFDPRTGKFHDGCARTIVYNSDNSKPVVLGSQWRLAPKSIDDSNATLEEKFRANLSRGAREMKIAPEHEVIINDFAVKVVQEFEASVSNYRASLAQSNMKRDIEEIHPGISEEDIFRIFFWASYLKRRLAEIGAWSNGSIVEVDRFEEENSKLSKKIHEQEKIRLSENIRSGI